MHLIRFIFLLLPIVSWSLANASALPVLPETSPVERYGQLRIEGVKLLDQHGKPVQLCGMSAFWLNWEGGAFANADTIAWLRKDWGISVFRAAVGVEMENGYLDNEAATIQKVDEIVQACVEQGIYVIIDYHTHFANADMDAAKRFFDRMSKIHGHLPNVLYEPWNEPEQVSWSDTVKPYMETIVDVIRKNDPDNIILAGTPWWSAHPDEAAEDWLDDPNAMAVLHFYTGTHKQDIRDRADLALQKGVPVFVSEFGVSIYDGGGGEDRNVYFKEADRWMEWMDANSISWANWSLCDKNESSAALVPGAVKNGNWEAGDLSASGQYIRTQCRMRASRSVE